MSTDTTILEEGIARADLDQQGEDAARKEAERQQVITCLKEIKEAREYDDAIRKQIARDRRYARGDSNFEVDVNVIGSNIDTMTSFIYARDPDVDCTPALQVEAPKEPPPQPPPPPPGIQGLMQDPTAALVEGGGTIEGAVGAAGDRLVAEQAEYNAALARYQMDLAAYESQAMERRVEKIRRQLFAQTLALVVSKLWKQAKLKRRARKAVRSALTTAIGWAKVSWQERTERDPVIQKQLNDLQDNLRRIARLQEEVEEGGGVDLDAKKLSIEQQLAGLQGRAEKIIARGLAIDFVQSENLQVAPGTDIMDYLDAPWLAERIPMRISDAAVTFPDVPLEKLRKATRYSPIKPKDQAEREAPEGQVSAKDADSFQEAGTIPGHTSTDDDYLVVWERWSLEDGLVYTSAEGMDCWLRQPAPPAIKADRYYGYFALAFIECDGERSPQSHVARSWKLQNEYNRTRTAYAVHRRRSRPAVLFDETEIDPENARKLETSASLEFIGLKPTTLSKALADCFAPKPVSAIDPALYDTAAILRDLDRIWGIQEALQGSIEANKTATEAEIQQTGFQSRTGSNRDILEDWLGEIAHYTAMIAVQRLEPKDVLKLAGPDAVWPQLETPEELDELVDIEIRAGSSGKPNTRGEREAWSAVMPMIEKAIAQVGQWRGSSPQEMADKVEMLVQETLQIAGSQRNADTFLPQNEGMQGMAPPAVPGGVPGAAPMPPTTEAPGVPPVTME